jgi:SulP family sulfate permease
MGLFASLRGYHAPWLRGDCVAGLRVWAVLVPESLAYATIAGVSPVVGLQAAPGALIFYAAFGRSRRLVTGPMAATAALSAAAAGTLASGNAGRFAALTATLAITVGVIAVAAALVRLGFVANLISEPVLKGFIIGLALTIIVGQVPKLIGMQKGSGDFFQQAWTAATRLGDAHWRTLLVGLGSLAVVLVLRRAEPAAPAQLVAVIAGIVAVRTFGLQHQGVKIVGHIDGGLPSLGFPGVPAADYLRLAGPAVGIALVGFAETLAAARTYAARNRSAIDPGRELAGLGAANVAAGLSAGMVVNGSLPVTEVNVSSGARTQLSGLIVAALTVVTLLFLTGMFQDLPEATLGAVVIAALLDLASIAPVRALYGAYASRLGRIYWFAGRADFVAAVAAMLGVLIFGMLPGLFLAIAVSLLLLIYRACRPNIATLGLVPGNDQWADAAQHPENTTIPQIPVLRVESPIFFANSEHVRTAVEQASAAAGVQAVVLDCATVPALDVTAARMLNELSAQLHKRGIRLVVARDVGQVRDVLTRYGENPAHFPTVRAAVRTLTD